MAKTSEDRDSIFFGTKEIVQLLLIKFQNQNNKKRNVQFKINKNNIQSVVCLQVVFIKLNGTKSDIRSDVENKIINKKKSNLALSSILL